MTDPLKKIAKLFLKKHCYSGKNLLSCTEKYYKRDLLLMERRQDSGGGGKSGAFCSSAGGQNPSSANPVYRKAEVSMAKQQGQKRKLLLLAQLLLARSDEEHPLTVEALIEALAQAGVSAERKSLYDDMEQLRQLGLDVQNRKGKHCGWFIGERQFQLPELKLLVDVVQSSRFLTRRKSDSLISKLESLTSVHQAKQLQRQVYVDRRVKTMNESIYYNVDKLHTAIGAGRAITFRYFEINVKKERVYRREGKRYHVSPYGLIWDNENYYLAGWDAAKKEVRHYRVDKMAELTITGLPQETEHAVDMHSYAQKHFSMFSGTEAAVRLRCRAGLAGVVLDRFGYEVMLVPDGEEWFTVTLDVVVSPQFWGWVFGLGEGVQVLGPHWAREEFHARLRAVMELYQAQTETPQEECANRKQDG